MLPISIYIMWHYALAKFGEAASNNLGDAFTRKNMIRPLIITYKVIQNVAQYHLHHLTYAAAKFKSATSNGLEIFLQKIHYLTLTLGQCHLKFSLLPSTSCDLLHLQSLKLHV